MKRKLLCALLAAAMVLALAACGSSGGKESESPAPKNITGYTFEVPEGFTLSDDNDGLWLAPDYPNDGSNITVVPVARYDEQFGSYTQESLEAGLGSAFAQEMEEEIDLVSDSFQHTTIDGVEAIRYRYHLELYGVALRQEVVTVNGANGGYSFTFTQAGDADWSDAYDACVASIRFTCE